MRNLYILFCITALLLTIAACTEKEPIIPEGKVINTTSINESDVTDFDLSEIEDAAKVPRGLNIDSLNLHCIAEEPFVVRAEYNDQTNVISFEYYDNSANSSTVLPRLILWDINNGLIQSGESISTSFVFNTNYHVDVYIEFDDETTFQDQFCVSINQFIPSVINVCSNHVSTVGCQQANRSEKRAIVIADITF